MARTQVDRRRSISLNAGDDKLINYIRDAIGAYSTSEAVRYALRQTAHQIETDAAKAARRERASA